jgi:hypothetical protein
MEHGLRRPLRGTDLKGFFPLARGWDTDDTDPSGHRFKRIFFRLRGEDGTRIAQTPSGHRFKRIFSACEGRMEHRLRRLKHRFKRIFFPLARRNTDAPDLWAQIHPFFGSVIGVTCILSSASSLASSKNPFKSAPAGSAFISIPLANGKNPFKSVPRRGLRHLCSIPSQAAKK